MAEWKKVKIGEIAKHRKGSITIQDDIEYKLCRVQLHRKGVVLREIRRGAAIKIKKQQLCHVGDLVVAEMDAKFGGYGFIKDDLEGAIVSSHYYLFVLDPTRIHRDYFQMLVHSGFIQNQIEAKGSTNYSSIRAWEFLNYTIPLPDIEHQRAIAKRFCDCYENRADLDTLSQQQLILLGKLRQAILQEAIEGKLTAEWRKQNAKLISGENHASKLLERIRAEKDKLIKEGKIRKENPLPPVIDDEKPFDLPEGWIWCRLGYCLDVRDGTHDTPSYVNSGIPLITSKNLCNGSIDFSNVKYISETDHQNISIRSGVDSGDILFAMIGTIGNPVIIPANTENFSIKNVALFKVFDKKCISVEFLYWYLVYAQSQMQDKAKGALQPFVSLSDLRGHLNVIPPIAEQKAIADRVSILMGTIERLEKQVSDRKEQSELLMQSVLREAFEHSHA